uniref:hypothetical protein n=1 Tax=uncultured Sphingomonas sp. TaxID=158754 RepID=UPI0035C9EE10
MMGSLLDRYVETVATDAVRSYLASDRFKALVRRCAAWAVQGLEPGYKFADREAFTKTVADRIHEKAREPVRLFGQRIWRKRMDPAECGKIAEQIVTDFLRGERIKFGDPRYDWSDGQDLADEDMQYWETCA